VIPAIVKGAAVFVSEIFPAPVFVAVKLERVFALPKVVPPFEVVTKEGPESTPLCVIVLPAVAVKMPLKVIAGKAMAALL
jgi:hypothetical protein